MPRFAVGIVRHKRFSVSSGGSPDDTGQWPVLPWFDLVLSGLTALGCQQRRRVGTPGLQSGRLGRDFIFWFDLDLPAAQKWTNGICRPAGARIIFVVWFYNYFAPLALGMGGDSGGFGMVTFWFYLLLPDRTSAWQHKQRRRVGTPGLQSGRLGSNFMLWFCRPNLGPTIPALSPGQAARTASETLGATFRCKVSLNSHAAFRNCWMPTATASGQP